MNTVYKDKRSLLTAVVSPRDSVLDVGFWGQAVNEQSPEWPHRILLGITDDVWGVDLTYDESKLKHPERYQKANAESFSFDRQFDVIFAGDLIEHLSNPGLFLDCCAKHLRPEGRLVITTPNCFNLFHMTEKVFKGEPSVNSDHTFYFNHVVLAKLLQKNGWRVAEASFIDKPEFHYALSWKRRAWRLLDRLVSFFTVKFSDTLVIVAKLASNPPSRKL